MKKEFVKWLLTTKAIAKSASHSNNGCQDQKIPVSLMKMEKLNGKPATPYGRGAVEPFYRDAKEYYCSERFNGP